MTPLALRARALVSLLLGTFATAGCGSGSGSGSVEGTGPGALTFTSKLAARAELYYSINGIQESENLIVLGPAASGCEALQFTTSFQHPMLALRPGQDLVMIELFAQFGDHRLIDGAVGGIGSPSNRARDWIVREGFSSNIMANWNALVSVAHADASCTATRRNAVSGTVRVEYTPDPKTGGSSGNVESGTFDVQLPGGETLKGTFGGLTACPTQKPALTLATQPCRY